MKKYFAIGLMVLTLAVTGGCGSTGTNIINDINGFITNTAVPDVCAAANYYTEYAKGVVDAAGAVAGVSGIVAEVDAGIGILNGMCSSGALTSTIQGELTTIDGYIQQLNSLVTQAKAKGEIK
jgi:hypothetical protein